MAKKPSKKPAPKKKPTLPKSLHTALKSAPKAARKTVRKSVQPATKGSKSRRKRVAKSDVLDRLWKVVMTRRDADPAMSHSARLLSRGMPKVAQKFGEEAVECVIEAVSGNTTALIAESADVLYHLLVVWVCAGVDPSKIWAELERREGVSGVAEKAARRVLVNAVATRKIP